MWSLFHCLLENCWRWNIHFPPLLLLQGYLGECVVGLQQSKCCVPYHTLQQNLFSHRMVPQYFYRWCTSVSKATQSLLFTTKLSEPKWLVLVEAFVRSILNHSQKALYITGLWLPVKKKIYDFEKLKTFRGWVPMNFHGTIKNCYWWFPMISGHGTEKLFSMGIEILGLMCLDAKNGFCDSRRIATLT